MTATTEAISTEQKLNWTNVAFFSAFHIAALAAPFYFSWQAVILTVFLHWFLGSIGITLGYHRLLSHRSFQVPQWLEYIIATVGALAMQGGPVFWVGGHRQHHGFTEDNQKDPYSANKGFWWSHIMWIMYSKPEHFKSTYYNKFAPDLASDPYYGFLDKYFLLLQVPFAALLYVIGEKLFSGLGMSFLVYGMAVRSVFLWHSTWLINSACHKWGYKNFAETPDHSTNLWWAAILTYGEGWHNNHHAYPKSARSGLKWWEIDPTWGVINLLQVLGLAKKVYIAEPWQAK
ncbi:acyl-CoA desaturase [Pseudanabaena sp. Chao 1811]|uniref:acyl-CoA desaturase n=1 Tax=Pseudanabaena sp. Chao 1811 TaxID=2963092 RepID=UPI0022F3D836|nr:fatty acid desaturase [Pseudanabaena sp. Chao 1811]